MPVNLWVQRTCEPAEMWALLVTLWHLIGPATMYTDKFLNCSGLARRCCMLCLAEASCCGLVDNYLESTSMKQSRIDGHWTFSGSKRIPQRSGSKTLTNKQTSKQTSKQTNFVSLKLMVWQRNWHSLELIKLKHLRRSWRKRCDKLVNHNFSL